MAGVSFTNSRGGFAGQLLLSVFVVSSLSASAGAFDVIYVNGSAMGTNTGTSWAAAYTDLQDALSEAALGDQIWVAKGTYHPAGPSGPRSATFQLLDGDLVYGGFAGDETSVLQRDLAMNATTLSGDLNDNDLPAEPESDCCVAHDSPGCENAACAIALCASIPECCTSNWGLLCVSATPAVPECAPCDSVVDVSDNSYHVVTTSDVDAALLDGFTITGGNDDRPHDFVTGVGGGILNVSGSPTFRNCQIVGNRATREGAGVFSASGSDTRFVNCLFSRNGRALGSVGAHGSAVMNRTQANATFVGCSFLHHTDSALGFGGAVVNFHSSHSTFVDCLFHGNKAVGGGAIANDTFSSAKTVNCRFVGNESGGTGGAIGLFNVSQLVSINTSFTGNQALDRGGAIWSTNGGVELFDSTIAGNFTGNGGNISVLSGGLVIANSIVWGNSNQSGIDPQIQANSYTSNYSCIEGWGPSTGGTGNHGEDPLFTDLAGQDGLIGTFDDDVSFSAGSPCIDAGDNAVVPADTHDLDEDNNTGEPTPIDLAGNPRFLDDLMTADTGSGSAPIVDMGAYEYLIDCNENHVPDSNDIQTGTSQDVDANGVPDECQITASIVDALPPHNAIDARQPHDLDGGHVSGWYFVRLTLSGGMANLTASDFEVSEEGGDGVAPGIAAVSVQGSQVLVLLTMPVQPGTWTTVSHPASGTSTRIGYLPGDVNGDGTSSPVDILALIDALNGVSSLPAHSTDINRDGATTPVDILREIDLLNGADAFEAWLFRTLPH